MVMEEIPSPQTVGREFVRQYYTLLHEAPLHLHRFYSQSSSFVHGGLESTEAVYGQHDIHEKIMQLNFRDCHAKIRHVDSHSTLSNGVVVQVSGELSNSGQPMRRFMQTFVLALQSPKKYYVHNDIFHYQDEVFVDDEPDADGNMSDIQDDVEADQEQAIDGDPEGTTHQTELSNYYNQPPVVPTMNGTSHPEEVVMPMQPQVSPIKPGPMSGLNSLQGVPPTQTPVIPTPPQEPSPVPAGTLPAVEDLKDDIMDVQPNESEKNTDIFEEPMQEPISNEPKTYANLLKSGPGFMGVTSTVAPTNKTTTSPVGGVNPEQISDYPYPHSSNRVGNKDSSSGGGYGGHQGGRPQRARGSNMRVGRDRGPGRGSFDDGNTNNENDRERHRPLGNNQMYADNLQLFVGNLPQNTGNEDLKQFFERFGAVQDVRINNKQNAGTRAPSFSFVVFESPSTVQEVLNSRPILFPFNNTEHKLNVEEKKARRPGMGPGNELGGRSAMGGGRGMGSNSGMRGGRGGRGGGSMGGSSGGYINRGDGGRGGPGANRGPPNSSSGNTGFGRR